MSPEVQRLNIKNGNFTFLDGAGRMLASFTGVDFRSSLRSALAIRGTAKVAKISLRDRFFLEQLQSPLRYEPDVLELSKISAHAGSGEVNGYFAMQPEAEDSPFTTRVTFSNVLADQIIADAGGSKGMVQGKLEGSFQASGKTADPEALSGKGEVFLRDGRVQQYSLLVLLGQILQIEELRELHLEQAHVKYRVKPGLIMIDELLLHSANIRLSASGTVTFDGKLKLDSQLAINDKIRDQLFKAIRQNFQPTSEAGYFALDFQVGGSVDRPSTNLMDMLVGRDLGNVINRLFGVGKTDRPKKKKEAGRSSNIHRHAFAACCPRGDAVGSRHNAIPVAMRVIAGSAGGIRLSVPKRGVRPTMDRVKAAIFSSLGDAIIGARVLDLFAGSGALGIEALSRGACSVLFVEEDRQSTNVIEKNLAKTKFEARVRQQSVSDFLRYASGTEKFQIVLADPPYEKTKSGERFTEKLLTSKKLSELLAPGGVFVLEKRPGEALPETKLWHVARQKKYGATEVLFLSAIRQAVRTRRRQCTHRGGQSSDSFYLQFALAHRASLLFAGLFDENGPPRRLPRKIRSTPGNLRPRPARAAVPESREKANMAARGQRGRSHDCPEAGPAAANART